MRGLIVLWLLVCSVPAVAGEVRVRDDTGRQLTLAAPAQRIVSLAPHVTEMLYAAGAGDRIVGAVEYSDWPEAARRIPRVGGYSRFDVERILALRPDVVIGWKSGNSVAQLEKLERLGLTLYVTEPRRLADIGGNLERLGELAGTMTTARRAAAAFRARHARLAQRYGQRPAVRLFYQIWHRPLMTVNGEHLISDAIRLCGGENVFAGMPSLASAVDVEAVLRADPEAIVASGMAEERPEWLDDWRRYPQLQAVRRQNLFFVPPDLIQRHSPRLLDGAERLCAALESVRARR